MNNTEGEEIQLVQLRNPWGTEYFNGTWSDVSDSWNHELLKKAGHHLKDDGVYFISIDDLSTYFDSLTIARDLPDWHRTNYLHADVPTQTFLGEPYIYRDKETDEESIYTKY